MYNRQYGYNIDGRQHMEDSIGGQAGFSSGRTVTERVIVCPGGTVKIEVAETHGDRVRGLLGRDSLDGNRGLLIPHCSSIHSCFMRFPIDAVWLDCDLRVIRIRRHLRSFRFSLCPSADSVLELAAGRAAELGIHEGTVLSEV